MKYLVSLCIVLFGILSVAAQTDSILIKRKAGTAFYYHGKMQAPKDLLKITQSNPEAYKLMKRARLNSSWANVIAFGGGFLLGWPIGTLAAGGDPNWELAAIGGGLIIISIPLYSAYNKNAIRAAEIYNNDLKQGSSLRMQLRFGWISDGVGFKLRF